MSDRSIDDDAPIRLQEACDRFFGGRLTPAALRAEARKGNLTIERIANKDFVTPAAVRDMRARCQVVAAARTTRAARSKAVREVPGNVDGNRAQAALRARLAQLRGKPAG